MSNQQQTPPDPSALLMGGGGAWAKFENHGDKVQGEILGLETRQATDVDNELKFFDNGDPIWEVVVTLQTAESDPEIEDDDGIRKVSLGGSKKYASKAKAAQDAVRAAGARMMEEGGKFALAYIGDGEPTKKGYTAPKLFAAQYKAPTQTASMDVFDEPEERNYNLKEQTPAPAVDPFAEAPF